MYSYSKALVISILRNRCRMTCMEQPAQLVTPCQDAFSSKRSIDSVAHLTTTKCGNRQRAVCSRRYLRIGTRRVLCRGVIRVRRGRRWWLSRITWRNHRRLLQKRLREGQGLRWLRNSRVRGNIRGHRGVEIGYRRRHGEMKWCSLLICLGNQKLTIRKLDL